MASVSTYLNFNGNTEEAFNFYKKVFNSEFEGQGIMRMGDIPAQPGATPTPEKNKNLVMHVSLAILAGHRLMGTDSTEEYGLTTFGTNMYINLEPDSREDVDRLFAALSEGGKVEMAPADMFWGDYYASFRDKYGVGWMLNFHDPKQGHSGK